jgi:large subunit ribosomal protein L23
MKLYDIINEPIITEKSMELKEKFNKYTFSVNPKANKIEIKNAVEKLFNVKVLDVATLNVKPRTKRVGKYEGKTSAYKKAICTLAEGNKISAFEL